MTATNGQARPSMLAELVAELERHGDGRPAEIARLGPSWNEHTILDALAELFAGGVVGPTTTTSGCGGSHDRSI